MQIKRNIRWRNIGDVTYALETKDPPPFGCNWREITRINPCAHWKGMWHCESSEPIQAFDFKADSLSDAKEYIEEYYSGWLYEQMRHFDKRIDLFLDTHETEE